MRPENPASRRLLALRGLPESLFHRPQADPWVRSLRVVHGVLVSRKHREDLPDRVRPCFHCSLVFPALLAIHLDLVFPVLLAGLEIQLLLHRPESPWVRRRQYPPSGRVLPCGRAVPRGPALPESPRCLASPEGPGGPQLLFHLCTNMAGWSILCTPQRRRRSAGGAERAGVGRARSAAAAARLCPGRRTSAWSRALAGLVPSPVR